MGLTVDQQIQVWNAVGTWFAGAAGVGAIITSLYLATRSSAVSLRAHVTLGTLVGFGPPAELIEVSITNLGDRPVTITNVAWRVGKRRAMRHALQNFSPRFSDAVPIELAHGKRAAYRLLLDDHPGWPAYFRGEFIRKSDVSTLRMMVATSIG